MVMEEEVVFKLTCQSDKVGSLIGKGGSVIRTIQNETGASIKIVDGASNSDERVVIISAREVGSLSFMYLSFMIFFVGCLTFQLSRSFFDTVIEYQQLSP